MCGCHRGAKLSVAAGKSCLPSLGCDTQAKTFFFWRWAAFGVRDLRRVALLVSWLTVGPRCLASDWLLTSLGEEEVRNPAQSQGFCQVSQV